MSRLDRAKCLKFVRECKIVLQDEPAFFHEVIAFYLDGVAFVYKPRPMTQALVPKGKVWRKREEGLKVTAKGSKNAYICLLQLHKTGESFTSRNTQR